MSRTNHSVSDCPAEQTHTPPLSLSLPCITPRQVVPRQTPPPVCVAFYSFKATLVTQGHFPPPHSSQTIPIPCPPTRPPLSWRLAPCQPGLGAARRMFPRGVHVLCEAVPLNQKRGRTAKGSGFRFCLLCLKGLFIVKVNDRIRLCTAMKPLNEDSISQALWVAGELLLLVCTPRDSASATVVGEHTQASHLLCTW